MCKALSKNFVGNPESKETGCSFFQFSCEIPVFQTLHLHSYYVSYCRMQLMNHKTFFKT
jgi:hypothetical protein